MVKYLGMKFHYQVRSMTIVYHSRRGVMSQVMGYEGYYHSSPHSAQLQLPFHGSKMVPKSTKFHRPQRVPRRNPYVVQRSMIVDPSDSQAPAAAKHGTLVTGQLALSHRFCWTFSKAFRGLVIFCQFLIEFRSLRPSPGLPTLL